MKKLGKRRRWRDVADCKSVGYALGSSNLSFPTILYLVVLKLISIILMASCSTGYDFPPATTLYHHHLPASRDTRTAGYPSDVMYPWLVGGKSKTKKYVKDDIIYIAPVCGQCR